MNFGILDPSEIDLIKSMIKKKQVLSVHKYKISKGGGKDKRWFTRTNDGKKIVSPTENGLYEKLYEIYFGSGSFDTVKTLYLKWCDYKYKSSNRTTNLKRIDSDFRRYYLEEPLSQDFINISLDKMTKYDLKLWASELIKKHSLTKKQFGNIMVPLRQMIDMLVDQGLLDQNIARSLTIDRGLFSPEAPKPDAETQVFFKDELVNIIAEARRLAHERLDESYLAILIYIYTGVRPGECYALKFSDFNRKNNSLCIKRSLVEDRVMLPDGSWGKSSYRVENYLKKNSKPRTIPVPDSVFNVLDEVCTIKSQAGKNSVYLFDVRYPGNMDRKIYRICDSLGLCRRSANKLRKTYISTLLNSGFDLDFVRKQAGHSNINTTLNNYTFATTRDEELFAKLEDTLTVPNCSSLGSKRKDPNVR